MFDSVFSSFYRTICNESARRLRRRETSDLRHFARSRVGPELDAAQRTAVSSVPIGSTSSIQRVVASLFFNQTWCILHFMGHANSWVRI